MSVNTIKASGTPITLTFNQSLDISGTEFTIIQKFGNIIVCQLFFMVNVTSEIPALTPFATTPNNALPLTVVNANGTIRNEYYNDGKYIPSAFRIGTDGTITCRETLAPTGAPSWNVMLSVVYVTN